MTPTVQLTTLLDSFPDGPFRSSDLELISPAEVPEPYARLLVHNHHMTVTLEDFHRATLSLQVLGEKRTDDSYTRRLTLSVGSPEEDRRVVLAGIMRIALDRCSDRVRHEILSGATPLGRILISNRVLRRVESNAYLRVKLSAPIRTMFALADDTKGFAYGRIARIFCDGEQAIELLEIVPPEPEE